MYKAIWNDVTIAEADAADVLMIEGNVYFPPSAVKREFLAESDLHTVCPWKGLCSYYDVTVEGKTNKDAAWYYANPLSSANPVVAQQNDKPEQGFSFANYVAFWHGVEVVQE
jgi:uncharacterized protein (DUF427 family)